MAQEFTEIIAKKDLYNRGKCFTKDQVYIVNKQVLTESGLMEAQTTNDLDQPHIIGTWWKNFRIIRN